MHKLGLRLAGWLVGGVLLAAATPAFAAAVPNPGARKLMQAVGSFRITEDFLQRDQALALDLAKDPCAHGRPTVFLDLADKVGKGTLTLDQAIRQFAAQPGMAALLARHGLSARDAFIGGFAMLGATMQTMPMPAGDTASGGPDTATSRANVAFLKAHMAELRAFQGQLGTLARARVHANGGRLPACEHSMFDQHPR